MSDSKPSSSLNRSSLGISSYRFFKNPRFVSDSVFVVSILSLNLVSYLPPYSRCLPHVLVVRTVLVKKVESPAGGRVR